VDSTFKSFYNRPASKTPNTSVHHQTTERVMGTNNHKRKHLNMVAACHSQQKEDPLIDRWVKRKIRGSVVISKPIAHRIMKTYGITNFPTAGSSKAINKTGISISLDKNGKDYRLSRH
jgi:hypothetical protein